MVKTFIIAEAGVNHNGDVNKALEMVNLAASAGADAIKFQTFNSESLTTVSAPKAKYQQENTPQDENQRDMLRRLELPKESYFEITKRCKEKKIKFMSTAFDSDSLSFLVNDLKVDLLKIPSGEITNGPFILEHARTGLDIILSTGMSNIQEIQHALSTIAFGYLSKEEPQKDDFFQAINSSPGRKIINEKVILLHCTSQYPALNEDINLRAIQTLIDTFNVRVGYSDHSLGTLISSNAISLGAVLIEKHFTLDKDFPGPDHKASLDPIELRDLVTVIRRTEELLGDGVKIPMKSEKENLIISRKSIVARSNIKKGDIFSKDNLTFKRPANGMSPMKFWTLIGRKSKRDYLRDDLIEI